jgi:hypothetical protein
VLVAVLARPDRLAAPALDPALDLALDLLDPVVAVQDEVRRAAGAREDDERRPEEPAEVRPSPDREADRTASPSTSSGWTAGTDTSGTVVPGWPGTTVPHFLPPVRKPGSGSRSR